MQLSFARGLMAGAAGAAVVLAITAATNGTGIGAVFNLGQINKVNATSTLTGKTNGPMLSVTNSGHGTALNLHVNNGHAPFSVNSSSQVAHLNASLLGGIGPAGFVHGAGHVVTAEVELGFGGQAVLFNLPGYGKFSVTCLNVPFAEMDFTAGSHNVHLWTQDEGGPGGGGGVTEQDMGPGAGLGFQTNSAEQVQWTIQIADSPTLNRHFATVETDFGVNPDDNSKCDFAAMGYAAP